MTAKIIPNRNMKPVISSFDCVSIILKNQMNVIELKIILIIMLTTQLLN